MTTRKKRIICIIAAVLLTVCIPLTVFAINGAIKPQSSGGTYEQKIVNRVNFEIENTDFTFKRQGSGTETYILSFTFSAKKTEADFYAMINSLSVEGITPNYILYTSSEKNDGVYVLNSVILPTENGEPKTLEWTAQISFNATSACTLSPEVVINYTSGMSKDTANSYLLRVPLSITVK